MLFQVYRFLPNNLLLIFRIHLLFYVILWFITQRYDTELVCTGELILKVSVIIRLEPVKGICDRRFSGLVLYEAM